MLCVHLQVVYGIVCDADDIILAKHSMLILSYFKILVHLIMIIVLLWIYYLFHEFIVTFYFIIHFVFLA
jgi:hypothetical protein